MHHTRLYLSHRRCNSAAGICTLLRSSVLAGAVTILAACSADRIDGPVTPSPQAAGSSDFALRVDAVTRPAYSLDTQSGPVSLSFNTYEGSGQVVHPDVVAFTTPWNGHRYWNVLTPYPNSAIQFENPSLFASDNEDNWEVPEGGSNPLMRTGRGYLSDPDMLFHASTGEMWLYYREVQNNLIGKRKRVVHFADNVWLTKSSDAVHWSAPQRVVADTNRFVVSPSVVQTPDGAMSMYQIDSGRDGCSARSTRITRRRSTDGIAWSKSTAVSFLQPGFVPWHLDVQYIAARDEYWALIAAYPPARGCTTTSLFLATSRDGVNWTTYPTPVLAAGETAAFKSAVYRSTFAYGEDGAVTIWYSGCKVVAPGGKNRPPVLAWSAAVSHTSATALFARVNDKTQTLKLNVQATPGTTTTSASSVP